MAQVGERLPAATFKTMTADGPQERTTDDVFGGKRVAVCGVPGAFTPTCSDTHLPGFVMRADELRGKGLDDVVCLAVNDVFVMGAWAKASGAEGQVTFLADGNGDFARAADLVLDLSGFGMGQRSKRFSMVVKDGVVEQLHVEPGAGVTVSSAEHLLQNL